ncbi:MAG TPA: OmpA family protein [Rhodanobacteraceae bacterium]|jgi:outer membrane protein OmpA-like peptidoglycan-associated protein|nr:OmpA family protein [Rhodanobacteraceae bacterium]
MKPSFRPWIPGFSAIAASLLIAGCATVPPGPPPDVVRLQNELDRLHADPRIAANGGTELANADAAVDVLARNERTLDRGEYQQGVYIADKLVAIAEASALARDAEQRGMQLGAERERLVAESTRRETRTIVTDAPPPSRVVRSDSGEYVPADRAELIAMQQQLPGIESRLDARGLVVRVGDYMFEPGRATLMPSAETSLDAVARVLRMHADAHVAIEGYGGNGLADQRADAVRDYLDARGVDLARVDLRDGSYRNAIAANDRRVDIVIRSDYR